MYTVVSLLAITRTLLESHINSVDDTVLAHEIQYRFILGSGRWRGPAGDRFMHLATTSSTPIGGRNGDRNHAQFSGWCLPSIP
ncbi:hypothetical protein BC938DRAFT_482547 [Jimgerdemannia flammicorona]|uniref:Uncharacterized protein n=1 Tax=Jimgerdemannia flammicorona TaxID=994334 RepID=A0A433QDV2_9FUNG|nr:hypothetical protein BC938DRAFT_482547 [Jimgerdemannia flammicorona]